MISFVFIYLIDTWEQISAIFAFWQEKLIYRHVTLPNIDFYLSGVVLLATVNVLWQHPYIILTC